MPFRSLLTDAGGALDALAAAIATSKGADPLASTTVIVSTNVAGVMARRALGRERGVIGVDMVTLNRLAELIAGPVMATQGRQPVSAPVLDLTIRRVLDEAPGMFAPVAGHPSTVVTLRDLHTELRLAGDEAMARLASTRRGAEAVRVSRAVTRILGRRWYDEADLLQTAAQRSTDPSVGSGGGLVMYLPGRLDELGLRFVRRLGEVGEVTVVLAMTGEPDADAEQTALLSTLGLDQPHDGAPIPGARPLQRSLFDSHRPRVISTTDADDEARIAVRTVVDAARGALTGRPVPFERIAVLWPGHRPYARLVDHHLTTDGIPWNGRGGTELTERLAPRLLLDLLDIDVRGLRRRALFELLADIPSRDADGRPRNTAEWERVSRAAGVSRDDDWGPRLGALRHNARWAEAASSLAEFVDRLREVLGRPSATRTWREWVDWCIEQLDGWLGRGAIVHLSDREYRGWEALMTALERLRSLDAVGPPVTRSEFRSVLDGELSEGSVREGRIGVGVTIGSLASAAGLDIDVAVVLGGAEGLLPPAPRSDPLLSDADRERAGLVGPEERSRRLHHEFRSLIGSRHTVITLPRGDLRSTTSNQITRWLADADAPEIIASYSSGLARVDFAPSERERRLRDRLRCVRAGHRLDAEGDLRLARNLTLRRQRQSDALTPFDGDLSGTIVPFLAGRDVPVSPTQIQTWASCPHAYFLRHLLGVYPVDERDVDIKIDALDQGLVQHDALDRFHRDVIAGRLPQPTVAGWTSVHRAALSAHFDDVCELFERSGRTGRPATWAVERTKMRSDILTWLDHDDTVTRARGSTIVASEYRFPADGGDRVSLRLHDGRNLDIRGSIDRLDRCADGSLVVTDHKTGKPDAYRSVSPDDPTLGGTAFQLPAYAAAAIGALGQPTGFEGGAAGVRVRSEYSMLAKGGYKRFGYEFTTDVWQAVSHTLGDIVDNIESGWFPQHPERPGFRMRVSCEYCEPDHLGTFDHWSRWQRKRHDHRLPWRVAQRDDPTSGEPDG